MSYQLALDAFGAQDWLKSLKIIQSVIKSDPANIEALHLKACILTQTGNFKLADQIFTQLTPLSTNPNLALDHAGVLLALGRPIEAIAKADPFLKSTIFLGTGDYKNGWPLFRSRFKMPDEAKRPTNLLQLFKKNVFLVSEQGFGDTIQFMRYAALLHPICHLTIGVPKELYRLYTYCTPYNVINLDDTAYPDHDWMIPVMDCPALFNTTLTSIPPTIQNLHYASKRQSKPMRVGVVWHGGSRPHDFAANIIDKRRSIAFDQFKVIFEVSKVKFFNLQLETAPGLQNVLDPQFDFFDTMEVMKSLDLVITIDSSVAHLSGSLNKPTWLLSRYDACWRWMWPEANSQYQTLTPWYPSMRLYRQPKPGDWRTPLDRVKSDLKGLVE